MKTVDDVQINITWTPLHHAAFHNRTRIIHALADVGADLEAKDSQGNTPLHIASMEGNVEAIRALFEVGVDDRVVNMADNLADRVTENDSIRDMIRNPGIYWPVKAYVVGIESSRYSNMTARITCNDGRRCRVFLNCTNEDGRAFQGWIDTLAKDRDKTTIDSITQEATLTFSVSDFRTLVDARGRGALGCALHSHQQVLAQVWSIADSGNANTTAYRLSETVKKREKTPIQFYYGDSSTPSVYIRCINDEERGCISVKLRCFNDKAEAWPMIDIRRIRPFGLYTIAGTDTDITSAGVDHWLPSTDKGWYSCDVSSTGPFMVYVTDLTTKGEGVRSTVSATAVSAE